jgi:hypothetical protein
VGAQSTAGSARLLIDYSQPERDAVLDLLFKPQFGASLQHLKVEIGGDGQISCGAEASGQRGGGSGAADWGAAGYEGWLMAEAKKRSPDLALLGLVSAWPAWVNPNGSSPWASPATEANAAAYVTAWVQGMHAAHNLSIDWVGLWNEREYTQSYVFTLRAALDAAGFAGALISAGGHDYESGGAFLADGRADAIAFGRWYISTPDLVARFARARDAGGAAPLGGKRRTRRVKIAWEREEGAAAVSTVRTARWRPPSRSSERIRRRSCKRNSRRSNRPRSRSSGRSSSGSSSPPTRSSRGGSPIRTVACRPRAQEAPRRRGPCPRRAPRGWPWAGAAGTTGAEGAAV